MNERKNLVIRALTLLLTDFLHEKRLVVKQLTARLINNVKVGGWEREGLVN